MEGGRAMRRLVDSALEQWRTGARRKPLIVRGARQVGKTHSILELGRSRFETVLQVDFERNPEYRSVFDRDLDPQRIVGELAVLSGGSITPGNSLLFLDEIQACPRAVVSLRYFKEQFPQLHVIAAGSLLEFAMRDVSFPVGRVQFLEMHPMTFAEFLWAMGREQEAALVLGQPRAPSATIHAHLMEQLRSYLRVGGMPEAVAAFAGTRSYHEAGEVLGDIVEAYRADFSKYAPLADKGCLRSVLASVARTVGHQVKYSRLAEGFSTATIHKAFDLLCTARIARKVRSASPAGLPLAAHASEKVFKALVVDVGLMQRLCSLKPDVEHMSAGLFDIYRGALAEQFVGQEMAVSQGDEPYYWARPERGSSAEVDFLAVQGDRVVPVEVKSGATGRLRSLKLLMEAYPGCTRALVFSADSTITTDPGGICRMPIYFAYCATLSS